MIDSNQRQATSTASCHAGKDSMRLRWAIVDNYDSTLPVLHQRLDNLIDGIRTKFRFICIKHEI